MKLPVLALALLTAIPAFAQDRTPSQRQVLLELANVIGQSHSIRQVCNGPDDGFWYERMSNLLKTEDADFEFSERLRAAFNAGFLDSRQRYFACNRITRDAEARLGERGQDLARRLAAPPAAAPIPKP